MSLRELSRDFDVDRYNALLEVEEANRIVRADWELEEFLASASQLFVEHNVHRRFGTALLHRHHTCGAGEKMTQHVCSLAGEPALVTKPAVKDIDYRSEVPWVWAVCEDRYWPLEFTSDAVAQTRFAGEGEASDEFLRDFAALASSSRIGHLVGLAIVDRELHESMPENCTALESSDLATRESIIFVRERSAAKNTIETTWAFKPAIDPASGCESQSSCQPYTKCECINDYGTHSHLPFERHRVVPGQHNPT